MTPDDPSGPDAPDAPSSEQGGGTGRGDVDPSTGHPSQSDPGPGESSGTLQEAAKERPAREEPPGRGRVELAWPWSVGTTVLGGGIAVTVAGLLAAAWYVLADPGTFVPIGGWDVAAWIPYAGVALIGLVVAGIGQTVRPEEEKGALAWPWGAGQTLAGVGAIILIVGILGTGWFLLMAPDGTTTIAGTAFSTWLVYAAVTGVGVVVAAVGQGLRPVPFEVHEPDTFQRQVSRIFRLGWGWNLARFGGFGAALAGGYLWYHERFLDPGIGFDVTVAAVVVPSRVLFGIAAAVGVLLIVAAQAAKALREHRRDKVLIAYREQQVRWLRDDED